MYEHFRPSDDVFVDREEYLEWMDEALVRCKKKSVVLHLKGIGGIGKSSLLKHWIRTKEKTVRVDCEQHSAFYDRLNVIAKGAVLHGLNLQRFDVLWQIRQRFVEGVEPVREEGRDWAKDIVMAIPFIGSLASIGTAITAVGSKVTPKLKGKYGTVGKWLQDRLGKNHVERLLEILWKEPRHAEFLYLDGLLEDINNRKDDSPILFLFDHFEYVDSETPHWRYQDKKINEVELWSIFLCSLKNCVSVMAGRKPPVKPKDLELEENELTELDCDSCIEMLDLQGVTDKELQEKIISVSGGNPFVIDAICDMINTSDVSVPEIEGFRAETLAEVRLKVWRRLFSQTEGLMDIISRAGLVPFFTREIMEIITPSFTSDLWNRMTSLSFVKDRGDGTYVLHDLAEDLVKAELGSRFLELSDEVAQLLEKAFEIKKDYALLGLSYAVRANDMQFCENLLYLWADFGWDAKFKEGYLVLDIIPPQNEFAYAIACLGRGYFLSYQNRIPEGEEVTQSALESFKTIQGISDSQRNRFVAISLMFLGILKVRAEKYDEAEEMLQRALELYQKVIASLPEPMAPGRELLEEGGILLQLGCLMLSKAELQKARQYLTSSLEKIEKWAKIEKQMSQEHINREIAFVLWHLGRLSLATNKLSETEEFSRRGLEISMQDIAVMNNLTILARSLYLKGHLKEAREVHLKEIEVASKMASASPEFPTLSMSLYDLYLIQRWSGEYHLALDTVKERLILIGEYMRKAPEVYEYQYINTIRLKGNVLFKIGKFKEAKKEYQKGIKLAREYIRRTHSINEPILMLLLNDYSVLLHQTNKLQKAEECLEEAIQICRRVLIEFPDSVIRTRRLGTCLCNLGATMLKLERDEEAEKYLSESLLLRKKIESEAPEVFYYHSFVASTMNNLAVFYGKTGNHEDAKEYLMKAIDKQISNRTEETSETFDPGLVGAQNNMGVLKARSGDISESKDEFNKALRIARSLHERNPETHRQALIHVLCNMFVVESKDNEDSEVAKEIASELRQMGFRDIPNQLKWFVEITQENV